jgi:hypothetical protein
VGQFPSQVHRRHGERVVALIVAVDVMGQDATRRPNQRMQLARARSCGGRYLATRGLHVSTDS